MILNPKESLRMAEELLAIVAVLADMRFMTVAAAAKQIGIPTAQLNYILNRDIGKITIDTLVTIIHKAGGQTTVRITRRRTSRGDTVSTTEPGQDTPGHKLSGLPGGGCQSDQSAAAESPSVSGSEGHNATDTLH